MQQFLDLTTEGDHIIGRNNVQNLEVRVYASYSVHNDMLVNTGGCMSMGWWMVYFHDLKKMINTNNSTKTKVVGVRK